jgi:hypothetical protein
VLELNLESVRAHARKASTEDLLDQATIYSADMDPDALPIIEEELFHRGLTAGDINAHETRRQRTILTVEGRPVKCHLCQRPAVAFGWGWHRMWSLLPIFPRRLAFCEQHRPLTHPAAEPDQ